MRHVEKVAGNCDDGGAVGQENSFQVEFVLMECYMTSPTRTKKEYENTDGWLISCKMDTAQIPSSTIWERKVSPMSSARHRGAQRNGQHSAIRTWRNSQKKLSVFRATIFLKQGTV